MDAMKEATCGCAMRQDAASKAMQRYEAAGFGYAAAGSDEYCEALKIEHVGVRPGRIVLRVRLVSAMPRMTDAAMARALLLARPSLACHSCVNDFGLTFADTIAHTSLPHVFEHLIIDEQVHNPKTRADMRFVGTTQWLDAESGLACIEINFYDDIEALRAVHDALVFFNGFLRHRYKEQVECRTGNKGADKRCHLPISSSTER